MVVPKGVGFVTLLSANLEKRDRKIDDLHALAPQHRLHSSALGRDTIHRARARLPARVLMM